MSHSNSKIRHATKGDAALLAELGAKTFSDTFAADNRPEDMADYLASAFTTQKLTAELSDPFSTFLIAVSGQDTIGYAKLYRGQAPACVSGNSPIELARLYVVRDWIGKGVGETLMRKCHEVAVSEAGAQTLWLGVWERNFRARAFYQKWGFREVGSYTFVLGSDPQTDILMEKNLPIFV